MFKLFEIITDAIKRCGWNYLDVPDSQYFPFTIKIYNHEECHTVKIYIWHIKDNESLIRPRETYDLQINGPDHIEPEIGGKTLILGWWKKGEVFAGFDYTKHTGKLGFSPSIQIREEALRKAYINGFAPWIKENREIAVAFRPDFFTEYVRNLESLHSFGESEDDFDVLDGISENPEEINEADIQRVTQPRQVTVANISKKVRVNSFRSRVLTAYGSKCAFCGIQLKLVDAAHILPVSYEQSTDETSNGLALCALHHRAYDTGLVTLNKKYQILYNENRMTKLKEVSLDGGMEKFVSDLRPLIHLPPAVNDRPHTAFIQKANEIRGWRIRF